MLLIQLFALRPALAAHPPAPAGPSNLVLPAMTLAAFLLPNIVLITRDRGARAAVGSRS